MGRGEIDMGLLLIPVLVLVIFFILVMFRTSKRDTKLDKAVNNLNDAKNEVEIHSIEKEIEEILNSINDED